MFDSLFKGTKMIDRVRKEAVSFYTVMTRRRFKLKNQSDFNKLSINVLTVVASYFNLRGKDFAKLRLINKKMKKAYERHVLSILNLENLLKEMGSARETHAREVLEYLLKITNESLPQHIREYDKQEIKLVTCEPLKKATLERIAALKRAGTE